MSHSRPNEPPRLVILGLDGATWDLITPWAEAGGLPNLASLMEKGLKGQLRSTLPFVTPLAWSSIYTGVEPALHGIFGFRKRLPGTYDWVLHTSGDLRRKTFWEIAAEEGIRSGIYFAPFTYPAQPFKGSMITGAFGPTRLQDRSVYPKQLSEQISSRFSDERLFAVRQRPGLPIGDVTDRMVEGVREQTEAMLFANQQHPNDVIFMVWHDTDRAAHLLWHHSDLPCPDLDSQIYKVYKAVDDSIGKILDTVGGEPTVIVCSDHGTYPIQRRINAHLWLKKLGLLELRSTPQIGAVSRASSVWKRSPASLKRLIPVRTRKKVQQKVSKSLIKQNALIEWGSTSVYPQPISPEAFFLNLKGREPDGRVSPEEKEEVVDLLINALEDLAFPDGAPLVRQAHRGTELFGSEKDELAPDVVAEPTLGTMFAPTGIGESEIFSVPELPDLNKGQPVSVGYHQRDGIYVVSGPGIDPGDGPGHQVSDIAPTALALLNVSIPTGLSGRPIETHINGASAAGFSGRSTEIERTASGLSADEEAEVARNLRDLGYLE